MAVDQNSLVLASCFHFLEMQNNYLQNSTSLMQVRNSSKLSLSVLIGCRKKRIVATRCQNYVELIVPHYTLDEFKEHFRLGRGTFEIILSHLNTLPEFFGTEALSPGRPRISSEKMLLMALWYLGNQETIRGISDRFGVTKSSVYKSTRNVCTVIVGHLMEKFIRWPTFYNDCIQQVLAGFEYGLPLPGCIGVIDSTHIAIKAPREEEHAYVNRKGFHSVILQAVCDHEQKFTDIFCGCAGSNHDATVLRSSPLHHEALKNPTEYFPHGTFMIGDQAYPLESWLQKKYSDTGKLSRTQQRFNDRLGGKRQIIEQAFALLKGRFRKLKMLDIDIVADIPQIVGAACTLHNICIANENEVESFLEYEDNSYIEEHQTVNARPLSGSVARDSVARLL